MVQKSFQNKNYKISHEQIHFHFISSELILDKHRPGATDSRVKGHMPDVNSPPLTCWSLGRVVIILEM